MFSCYYGKTFELRGSILGFAELNEFQLLPVDDTAAQTPFAYLQSLEEPNIGFIVADPFSLYPDYQIELSEPEKTALGASDPKEVIVLVIVTVAEPFDRSTVNLLAPLLIHRSTFKGRQIVLPPDSPYTTKTALPERRHEEEASC
jgi:flagellar assembly factor FliW